MFPISFIFLCIGSLNLKLLCLNLYNAYKVIVPDIKCGDDLTNESLENYITYLYEFSRILIALIYLKLVIILLVMCLIFRNKFKTLSIVQKKYIELK